MGIRLYPHLKEGFTAAEFLGVNPAKIAELAAIEANPIPYHDMEASYARWLQINNDPELALLHGFDLSGWGKFSPLPSMRTEEDGCIPYSGKLENRFEMGLLLSLNDIFVPKDKFDMIEYLYCG